MDRPWWEDLLRFLCENTLFFCVLMALTLLSIIYGMSPYRLWTHPLPAVLTVTIEPRPQPATGTETTPTSFASPATPPIPEVIEVPVKPEFSLVFVPVNWGSGSAAFEEAARLQAEVFLRETGIESYFTVELFIVPGGLEDVSLASNDLVYDVMEFALLNQRSGDRYIGLTDSDLRPDGDSTVVGWTSGGQSVVAEYQDEYVVAHELGHTFGLCDEYSYVDWNRQDRNNPHGCPNPFPASCLIDESIGAICAGTPARDGNSIMGPSGLLGEYSFNDACLNHLTEVFAEAVARSRKP